MKPLHDFLLIARVQDDTYTKGNSITLRDEKNKDYIDGIIEAMGPGRRTEYGNLIQPQNNLIYKRVKFNSVNMIECDDVYCLVRFGDIVCVYDDEQ